MMWGCASCVRACLVVCACVFTHHLGDSGQNQIPRHTMPGQIICSHSARRQAMRPLSVRWRLDAYTVTVARMEP
jgi:hypothetical protein